MVCAPFIHERVNFSGISSGIQNNSINSTSSEPAAIIVLRSQCCNGKFYFHHAAKISPLTHCVAVETNINISLLAEITEAMCKAADVQDEPEVDITGEIMVICSDRFRQTI